MALNKNNRRYSERVVEELLRSLRGSKTQRDFADSLGISVSKLSRWETGQVAVPWGQFCEMCERLSLDLQFQLKLVGVSVLSCDAPAIFKFLLGDRPVRRAAKDIGVSFSRLSRWMSGASEPSVVDVFFALDNQTHCLPHLVAALTDIEEIKTVKARYKLYDAAAESFSKYPKSSLLHIALHLQEVETTAEGRHSLAERLSIETSELEKILKSLLDLGLITKADGVYRPEDVTVYTNPSNEDAFYRDRKIKSYWLQQAAAINDADSVEARRCSMAYNVLAASQDTWEEIHQLQNEYNAKLKKIFDDAPDSNLQVLKVMGQFEITY